MGQVSVKEGDTVSGIVIFIDSESRVIEISCEEDTCARVKTKNSKTPSQGDSLQGKIIMSKTEHSVSLVLITQPSKFSGQLGYIGTRHG